MTDNNIVNLPTPMNVLADRIRGALARVQRGHIETIEGMLELAVALKEARDCFSDNRQFSIWLAENELDAEFIGHNNRAALINMAGDIALARIVLAETRRTSPELIWREEMQPRLTSACKNELSSTSPPETPEIAPNSPAESQPPVPETTESKPDDHKLGAAELRRSRSPLSKLPNADLVLAHVLSGDTRGTLGKVASTKKGRALWNLLIECIDNGAFGPPSNASIVTPNLRILFPWMQPKDRWVSGFDLTKPNDIQKVREFILPVVLVTEDRSALAINTIRREVERRQLQKDEQVRQELAHQRHQQKVAAGLPDGQEEVIAYGTPLWPSERSYSYEELVHACWFADFMFDILRADTPTARSMNLLHALKFLEPPMISAGTLLAIRDIAAAYVRAPQQASKWPPKPSRFFLSA